MKNKTIKLGSIVIVALVLVMIIGTTLYSYMNSQVELKQESIVLEYGEEYEVTLDDCIDFEKYSHLNKEEFVLNNNLGNTADLLIGEYSISVSYKGKELIQKIEVVDSTAPTIIVPTQVDLIVNEDIQSVDFVELVMVKDHSEINSIEFDLDAISIKTVGTYTVSVSVSDIHGNSSTAQFDVQVVREAGAQEEVSTNLVTLETGAKNRVVSYKKVTVAIPTVTTPSVTTPNTSTTVSESFVSKYSFAANTTQIIDVKTNGSHGVLTVHNKINGLWQQTMSMNCRIGKLGVIDDALMTEGNYKTPAGVYTLGQAFGVASDPGSTRPYLKVTENHYWVDDPDSPLYNQLVDISETGLQWNSAEHLISYKTAYKYAIEINFNKECIPGKSSAIFLHCSTNSATAGCVSVSEANMIKILKTLTQDTIIKIY